jgi:hypothetical protein
MTKTERLELFDRIVDQLGPTAVAKRIERSPSAVSQIRSRKYAGSPDVVLELVEAAYGETTLICPELGDIPLETCIEERAKPFMATSGQRVRLYRACLRCSNNNRTSARGGALVS